MGIIQVIKLEDLIVEEYYIFMLPEEFLQIVYHRNLFSVAAYSKVIDACQEMLRLQISLAR